MKKIAIGCFSLAIIITNLSHAGTMGSIDAYNPIWSGFYIGGEIGGAWLHVNETETTAFVPPLTGHSTLNNKGLFLGGGYVGINFQKNNIVFGVEGNFDGTTLNKNDHCLIEDVGAGNVSPGSCFPGAYSFTTKMPWEAAVRGRIGLTWKQALVYMAGGVAFVNLKTSFVTPLGSINSPPGTQNFNNTKTGGTVGVGLEYMINNHWITRAEYRYANYGSISYAITNGGSFWNGYTDKKSYYDNELHVGLSYLFG